MWLQKWGAVQLWFLLNSKPHHTAHVTAKIRCGAVIVMPHPMCTILSSLGGPKALLVPQGFVLPTWHQASWEKASYTSREGTPYEPGSGYSLKRCETLSTQCLNHTLKGEPSSALIPSVTPHLYVHDIVLFRPPKEDNTVHMGAEHDSYDFS